MEMVGGLSWALTSEKDAELLDFGPPHLWYSPSLTHVVMTQQRPLRSTSNQNTCFNATRHVPLLFPALQEPHDIIIQDGDQDQKNMKVR
ncbi:hypothetical protein GH733_014911 [Mirounga leonina]|nr:hypothetical protein GH733_014911 [Mirounga leonina]